MHTFELEGRKVQWIVVGDIERAIDSFDLSCVQAKFDGSRVSCSLEYIDSLLSSCTKLGEQHRSVLRQFFTFDVDVSASLECKVSSAYLSSGSTESKYLQALKLIFRLQKYMRRGFRVVNLPVLVSRLIVYVDEFVDGWFSSAITTFLVSLLFRSSESAGVLESSRPARVLIERVDTVDPTVFSFKALAHARVLQTTTFPLCAHFNADHFEARLSVCNVPELLPVGTFLTLLMMTEVLPTSVFSFV